MSKKQPPKTPVVPQASVWTNGTYWAPWGDGGWSAVKIVKLGRIYARAIRVKPKTGEEAKTRGKVRMDELVRRDPKLQGADRPESPPVVVFADVRLVRSDLEKKAQEKVLRDEEQAGQAMAESVRRELASEDRVLRVLSLLEDESTEEDW